jgi:hypothetical protein
MPLGKDIQGLRFSEEDADLFLVHWEVGKNGYVFNKKVKASIRTREYAHAIVALRKWGRKGLRDMSRVVEHRDRNKLNCTRENLRLVPQIVNVHNRELYEKPFGVTWSKHRSKWRARVTVANKTYYLGNYFDKVEAQKVVDEFCSRPEYLLAIGKA